MTVVRTAMEGWSEWEWLSTATPRLPVRAWHLVEEAMGGLRGRGADVTEGSSEMVSLGSGWGRQIWKPEERARGEGGQGDG